MADPRLIDYIRENLQRGPVDELVQILLDQGWTANEINEAIDIIQGPPATARQPAQPMPSTAPAQTIPSKSPASRPTGVTIICVLGFLLSVLTLIQGVTTVLQVSLLSTFNIGQFVGNTVNEIFLFAMALLGFAGSFLLFKMKRVGWIIAFSTGIIYMVTWLITNTITLLFLSVFPEIITTDDFVMKIIQVLYINIASIVLIPVIAYLFRKRKFFA